MANEVETIWGFDMLVVDKDGTQVGVIPRAEFGTTFQDAVNRSRLRKINVNGLPPETKIAGVRAHIDHVLHLLPPEARSRDVFVGPAVPVDVARELLATTRVEKKLLM